MQCHSEQTNNQKKVLQFLVEPQETSEIRDCPSAFTAPGCLTLVRVNLIYITNVIACVCKSGNVYLHSLTALRLHIYVCACMCVCVCWHFLSSLEVT